MIHQPMNCQILTRQVKLKSLLLVLIVLVSCIIPHTSVLAADDITVNTNTVDYVYSQQIQFTLEASSGSLIDSVILFYGITDEPLVRRIYPPFDAGKRIDVSYVEELVGGQFAPGTILQYYWRLTTRDGATLQTEPNTFEYTDTNHKWKVIDGERVELYWYGNKSSLAKELATKADDDILTLEERYGIELDTKLRIYVYNNTSDMSLAMASRSEGYDESVTTLGVAVGETTLLLLGNHRDVRETLAHELSHLVVGLATDNPFAGVPLWLDEGLAMYAEGELRTENQDALDQAIRNNSLLTIRSMSSYSGLASQVDLYYGEAFSIVDFMLREYGEDQVKQLLLVLSEGERQEPALNQVFGFGLDELDRLWRISVGADALPTN